MFNQRDDSLTFKFESKYKDFNNLYSNLSIDKSLFKLLEKHKYIQYIMFF